MKPDNFNIKGNKYDNRRFKQMVKRTQQQLTESNRLKKGEKSTGRPAVVGEEIEHFLVKCIADKCVSHGMRQDTVLYSNRRIKSRDLLDLANFKLQEKEKKLRSATTVLNLSKPRYFRSRQSKLHRGSRLFCTKAPYKEGNLKCQITKTDTEIECFSYYFSYRRIQDLQSFWRLFPQTPTRALSQTH